MPETDPRVALFSIGTAVPPERYSQKFLAEHFSLTDPKALRFFRHPHVENRHLFLPSKSPATGKCVEETTGALLEKFKARALELGGQACQRALKSAGLRVEDIDYLCCVSSTGFIVPGLSAWLIRELGFRRDCQRADIVGMGCNAGLNALNVAASWCEANPGRKALLVCAEICSAIYAVDESERTAIVNSLFGDGVAACVLGRSEGAKNDTPFLLGFESQLIPEHISALRFDWDDVKHRYSFFIDKQTPRVLAENVQAPLDRLLKRFSVRRDEIRHWIAHTGGAAILDGIAERLGLAPENLRHTRSVLRDFGNLSSGSFLFSLARLQEERHVRAGDYGIMMTMGPGLTIEIALARFA